MYSALAGIVVAALLVGCCCCHESPKPKPCPQSVATTISPLKAGDQVDVSYVSDGNVEKVSQENEPNPHTIKRIETGPIEFNRNGDLINLHGADPVSFFDRHHQLVTIWVTEKNILLRFDENTDFQVSKFHGFRITANDKNRNFAGLKFRVNSKNVLNFSPSNVTTDGQNIWINMSSGDIPKPVKVQDGKCFIEITFSPGAELK